MRAHPGACISAVRRPDPVMIDDSSRTFLFDLLSTPSPTGFEIAGQRKWAAYISQFADSVENDAYGSAWATLKGRGSFKLMIEAHADEIGYMIKSITAQGFVHVDRIGGSDNATARGRRLDILGDKGVVRGVIGNTAIHIRDRANGEKVPEVHELYVDVGASTAEEVAALGLRVGHPAVYADTVEPLGEHRLLGRALDNRICGFIIAEVLRRLAPLKKKLNCTVIAANCVQEEIGGYGAAMASYRLKPDAAICLDVTHATDTPGIDQAKHGTVKLGGGPSVQHGRGNHPNLTRRLMEIAEAKQITLQHEASSRYSGTDTDSIYCVRDGIPSALMSLPLRYMHSVVECCDMRDAEKIIDILVALALSIQPGDAFGHQLSLKKTRKKS